MITLLAFTTILFTLAIIYDLRYYRIPNLLCVVFFAIGCFGNFYLSSWFGLGMSLVGSSLIFLLLIPFFVLKTLGAGDIKLMMAVGALLGPGLAIWTVIWGVIVGGAIALIIAAPQFSWVYLKRTISRYYHCLYLKTYIRPATNELAAQKVPYALALASGFAVTCYLEPVVSTTLTAYFL